MSAAPLAEIVDEAFHLPALDRRVARVQALADAVHDDAGRVRPARLCEFAAALCELVEEHEELSPLACAAARHAISAITSSGSSSGKPMTEGRRMLLQKWGALGRRRKPKTALLTALGVGRQTFTRWLDGSPPTESMRQRLEAHAGIPRDAWDQLVAA